MTTRSSRRQFLQSASLGTATVGLSFLSKLPPVSAQEAQVNSDLVRIDAGVEPLVKLIEDTPRNRVLEEVASRIQSGTSYQQVLAALLLAGIRNVQPYPSVGFKFHCVLAVNSCHLASLHGPERDRWLPIFWALDNFKSAQADEARTSGWKMPPVKEHLIADVNKSRELFVDAMNRWDREQADLATVGLVRQAPATEVFNLYAQYAARDFRSIGHKVIFLANAWRTLEVIGWQYAEPVFRSLTAALLNHQGEANPAQSDLGPDRSWRVCGPLAEKLSPAWLIGQLDPAAPRNLLQVSRTGNPQACVETANSLLQNGVSPQSVWDGVFMSAAELLMRQPGIVGLHGLTTANAMHFVYRYAADDVLRRKLLLQASAFNAHFLEAAKARGALKDVLLEEWEQREVSTTPDVPAIVGQISESKLEASSQLYAYLRGGGNPYQFIDEARRQIFLKGRDSHDYKYSSAVLEDFAHVSADWRLRFLALSVFNLKGSGDQDNSLVKRIQSAMG